MVDLGEFHPTAFQNATDPLNFIKRGLLFKTKHNRHLHKNTSFRLAKTISLDFIFFLWHIFLVFVIWFIILAFEVVLLELGESQQSCNLGIINFDYATPKLLAFSSNIECLLILLHYSSSLAKISIFKSEL
jgi:hypothetical protein